MSANGRHWKYVGKSRTTKKILKKKVHSIKIEKKNYKEKKLEKKITI